MAKEKKARDTELTKEEMLPLDEEAQAALLDENEALKAEYARRIGTHEAGSANTRVSSGFSFNRS